MQKQCCVPGCGELMEPLCRLPIDETHQREWLKVIGNPSLKTKSHKAVYFYYRICRKHFTDEAFQNLRYTRMRLRNLDRILNNTPTLHMPVITNKEILDMKQIELLAEKEVERSNHFIDKQTSSNNTNRLHTTPLKTGTEPRTYCRKVKVKSEGNLGKEEPLKSHAETEINNRTEIFACSSIRAESIDPDAETELHKIDGENVCIESDMLVENASLELQNYHHKTKTVVNKIKKERIDLETEKELHKIDEENVLGENDSLKLQNYDFKTQIVVNKIKTEKNDLEIEEESIDLETEDDACIESDIFGQNASPKLQHKDHKTLTVKNKIKKESDDFEIRENSIILKPDTDLPKIDEESSIFGEHVSLKLQSYDKHTKTIVKNLIEDILFNADNRMYD